MYRMGGEEAMQMIKEKYNVSSRAIGLPHLNRLHTYQQELINFMLYETATPHEKVMMMEEIKKVERYLQTNYHQHVI